MNSIDKILKICYIVIGKYYFVNETGVFMSQITKKALAPSLKNLLLKKPLNKITINDITDDCGINRMTFYYHFKDIYDLAEWACLQEAAK